VGKEKRVTTSEIARLCGVSRTTVSAVLNGKPTVREQTREKVLSCIRENNYQPGLVAKALVAEISNMVAILVADLTNPFYFSVFDASETFLDKHGYHVLIHKVRHEDEPDPQTLNVIKSYRPIGYIIPAGAEGVNALNVRTVVESDGAVVSIDRVSGVETNAVVFDLRSASRRMTDYVLDKGHRNIIYLAGQRRSRGSKERQLGFMESIVEHELPFNSDMIIETSDTSEEGYRAAKQVLSTNDHRPTALICFNDLVAIGVYRAAHELGLHIPQDVSVTGFDGIELGEVLGPPLTTVSIHPHTLGVSAAELLLEVIKSKNRGQPIVREIEFELVERDSVRSI